MKQYNLLVKISTAKASTSGYWILGSIIIVAPG